MMGDMYDDEHDDVPSERPSDPSTAARDKSDELRMHSQLAAVFEGPRKFQAAIRGDFDGDVARELQRAMARLEKSKAPDAPVILPAGIELAAKTLRMGDDLDLAPDDYHIHRRPGEAMIARWIKGEAVEIFYQRLQAHYDAAAEGVFEDHLQTAWKSDVRADAMIEALRKTKVVMAERYLRDLIAKHKLFVLSTQTADEIDILHLAEHLMGVSAAEVVGAASAPPDAPTQRDRAWYFRLFSLRGMDGDIERMCFFTYLQKTDDTFDLG